MLLDHMPDLLQFEQAKVKSFSYDYATLCRQTLLISVTSYFNHQHPTHFIGQKLQLKFIAEVGRTIVRLKDLLNRLVLHRRSHYLSDQSTLFQFLST